MSTDDDKKPKKIIFEESSHAVEGETSLRVTEVEGVGHATTVRLSSHSVDDGTDNQCMHVHMVDAPGFCVGVANAINELLQGDPCDLVDNPHPRKLLFASIILAKVFDEFNSYKMNKTAIDASIMKEVDKLKAQGKAVREFEIERLMVIKNVITLEQSNALRDVLSAVYDRHDRDVIEHGILDEDEDSNNPFAEEFAGSITHYTRRTKN